MTPVTVFPPKFCGTPELKRVDYVLSSLLTSTHIQTRRVLRDYIANITENLDPYWLEKAFLAVLHLAKVQPIPVKKLLWDLLRLGIEYSSYDTEVQRLTTLPYSEATWELARSLIHYIHVEKLNHEPDRRSCTNCNNPETCTDCCNRLDILESLMRPEYVTTLLTEPGITTGFLGRLETVVCNDLTQFDEDGEINPFYKKLVTFFWTSVRNLLLESLE